MSAQESTQPVGGCYITFVDGSGALRVIAFDAVMRVSHSGESQVTEHPIDSGAVISDHVRPMPRKVSIEAEVTNTPILAPDGISGGVSSLTLSRGFKDLRKGAIVEGGGGQQFGGVPLIGPVTIGRANATVQLAEFDSGSKPESAQVLQFDSAFDRLQDVWNDLESLRIGGVEVTIVSRLTQYLQAVIVSVSAPEEGPTDAITFSIEAKEITRASSETVTVSPRVSEKRAQAPKAAGATPSYSLEGLPPAEQPRATILKRLVDNAADYYSTL